MPVICDVDKIYMGPTQVQKIYAGHNLIWPCYDCSIEDPEYADEFYSTAVMYIPKVCVAAQEFAPKQFKDAWPNVLLPEGPAYNGLWSINSDQTWGFNPPISYTKFGEIITEEDSLWITGFGRDVECSVSFFITATELSADDDGLLFNVDGLEIYLFGYTFFPPAIRARALRHDLFFPIEVVSTETLELDEETHVIVTYEDNDVVTRLRIYFDNTMVGEYTV